MMPTPLSRLAQWCAGRLLGDDVLVEHVVTDTRTLDTRDGGSALFVALIGERFDGHDHVAAAAAVGARAALVQHRVPVDLPQVVVADTARALAALAAAVQRGRATRVVAVTGSNGKTTVKQLALSIFAQAGGAYGNPGNRNNEIGLPLAVLDAPEDAPFAIYEMGAGKPGDIAYLTGVVQPDVALVNNIAAAHLERMGSLVGIAGTKAAIYEALPADGVAVINADDAFAGYFRDCTRGRRQLTFGIEADADLRARDIRLQPSGSGFTLVAGGAAAVVALPLQGLHNVRNALAAAALAQACGIGLDAIVAGLQAVQPVAGRLVRHALDGDVTLIDDSYNANPGSLAAAIETLASLAGEHWLVLGDMRELGADAEALHAEAGRRARGAGITRLYALGELSAHAAAAFGAGSRRFEDHRTLAAALRHDLDANRASDAARGAQAGAGSGGPGLQLLVKGSRGSAMDRVVTALLEGDTAHAA
ncbi:MAG TPA: UDP-N-acetylmuramoyl-tripeptide--D-alanyl-D-alanine ligase [Luteimonas sp.]|nr:UDP-N-acetylmuramoyl-tripeptide--D-alanyl-D-alanine ligase [Luteimonas sp.]